MRQLYPIGRGDEQEDVMWTAQFWKDAGERALRTFVQAAVSLWAVTQVTDLADVDWQHTAGVAGFAATLSLATSLIGGTVDTKGSASLVPSVGGAGGTDEYRG